MSALTTQVQGLGCRIASLQGLRDWIRWLYWQDVLNPGVECGVAFLLERGHVGICWLPMASGCVVALDAFLMYPSMNVSPVSHLPVDSNVSHMYP
jgi:hypothetical protein